MVVTEQWEAWDSRRGRTRGRLRHECNRWSDQTGSSSSSFDRGRAGWRLGDGPVLRPHQTETERVPVSERQRQA